MWEILNVPMSPDDFADHPWHASSHRLELQNHTQPFIDGTQQTRQ